jgi:hypothetical protein
MVEKVFRVIVFPSGEGLEGMCLELPIHRPGETLREVVHGIDNMTNHYLKKCFKQKISPFFSADKQSLDLVRAELKPEIITSPVYVSSGRRRMLYHLEVYNFTSSH